MVSFTVRMKFAQEEQEEISEMLRELTAGSRAEPGCVTYVAHFAEGDPETVVIYEQFANEAAAEFHRTTPHFQRWWKRIAEATICEEGTST